MDGWIMGYNNLINNDKSFFEKKDVCLIDINLCSVDLTTYHVLGVILS